MNCEGCGHGKIFARGLCQACYWRLRRNGTLERKNVVNQGKCAVEGCGRVAFAKNLCSKHYQRKDHPLKATWKLLRSRAKGDYPQEWNDFHVFLADVGERPTEYHQLRRLDPEKPWSKLNMVWREPIQQGKQPRTREEKSAYARAWDIRKKYGLSEKEFAQMNEAQDGLCAICGKPEERRHRNTFRPLPLVVDHCHRTGDVRQLLCSNCNRGLGAFDDDVERLRAAIAYLERHAVDATSDSA